jgi:hypothetical protein
MVQFTIHARRALSSTLIPRMPTTATRAALSRRLTNLGDWDIEPQIDAD